MERQGDKDDEEDDDDAERLCFSMVERFKWKEVGVKTDKQDSMLRRPTGRNFHSVLRGWDAEETPSTSRFGFAFRSV